MKEGKENFYFLEEIRVDVTLKTCRELATRQERGYRWENGLLLHRVIDFVYREMFCLSIEESMS